MSHTFKYTWKYINPLTFIENPAENVVAFVKEHLECRYHFDKYTLHNFPDFMSTVKWNGLSSFAAAHNFYSHVLRPAIP